MAHPRVTIVGATGAVGKVALAVLEERAFPMERLRLTASPRSIGKKVLFKGEELTVEETTPEVFAESDIAFISANDDISRDMALAAKERGCVVIDDSGVWRMDPDVPLVVPEINAGDVDAHSGILAIPNCSTTPLVMALDALRQASPIRRVIAATYQSVTGTGSAALAELEQQSRDYFAGTEAATDQYPHPIAFNLLPHVGSFRDGGHTSEEMKMLNETRKILHEPDLPVSATCVRVPVRVCHSEAVNIEFERSISVDEARELLANYPGIAVVDDPATNAYPMPLDGEGKDEVFVGRIREDVALPNGLALWLVSDNLRKGAATNAVQIAEEVVARGLWRNGAARPKAGATA